MSFLRTPSLRFGGGWPAGGSVDRGVEWGWAVTRVRGNGDLAREVPSSPHGAKLGTSHCGRLVAVVGFLSGCCERQRGQQ